MNNTIPPVIKWSGSKRSQANNIIKLFPKFKKYYEPFLGGGSVLICYKPNIAICGDICKPLIDFWELVKNDPNKVINSYNANWKRLQKDGYKVYYKIRDDFNKNPNATDMLFLSRTCVNGLIRFNNKGEFNNSFHHTRNGINPNTLKKIVYDWSVMIKNVKFYHADYAKTTKHVTANDFIYLDPPYFNTKGRYYGKIDYERFWDYLEELNSKNIRYALSFDGSRAKKQYNVKVPKSIFKRHLILGSGNSPFKKIMDKTIETVRESIYLNY